MKDGTQINRADEIEGQIIPLGSIKPSLSVNYLVKGWLSASALSVMFGASNTGKTFAALDVAFHVAAGAEWRGHRVRKGPVIYIAGEGGLGIRNRLAAYVVEHPEFGGVEFFLLPMALNLHEDIDVKALCEALPTPAPALIVVDTLSRCMGDGDENKTPDMNRFVASCDLLRKVTGAHVMVVHHTGKDQSRGARGSYALYAATDTEIKITDEREIVATKQRDMPYPESLHFALSPVTLGTDEDGDPVTSAIAIPVEAPAKKRKPLTGVAEIAMQALMDALRDHGETRTGNCYPANRKVVHIDRWREACAAHGLTKGESESAARKAFVRNKKKLMELDEVREWGDHVWRVQDDG